METWGTKAQRWKILFEKTKTINFTSDSSKFSSIFNVWRFITSNLNKYIRK